MDKKTEGMLQLAAAIAIIALVIYFSDEIEGLSEYGYVGVFFISILSHATLIFPSPGWAAVIAMSQYLDPLLLGIAAGVGSAIGELTGYVAGEGARDLVNNRIKESEQINQLVKKYGTAAIFFFAFIPNPIFDIAGLFAGSLRIPWWQFVMATAAGRTIRYALLAMIGAIALGTIS